MLSFRPEPDCCLGVEETTSASTLLVASEFGDWLTVGAFGGQLFSALGARQQLPRGFWCLQR